MPSPIHASFHFYLTCSQGMEKSDKNILCLRLIEVWRESVTAVFLELRCRNEHVCTLVPGDNSQFMIEKLMTYGLQVDIFPSLPLLDIVILDIQVI